MSSSRISACNVPDLSRALLLGFRQKLYYIPHYALLRGRSLELFSHLQSQQEVNSTGGGSKRLENFRWRDKD